MEVRLGHEQVDAYLRFVGARCRPNSVLAAGYDLKVFFTAVGKQPAGVDTMDMLEFITAQRAPRRDTAFGGDDQDEGLSFSHGTAPACHPFRAARVPPGLRPGDDQSRTAVVDHQTAGGLGRSAGVPLIRTPRTLPRVLGPVETLVLLTTLRTARDRAMVQASCWAGSADARSSGCA
ncbi:MAG: hypothetical protein M3Y71_12610 [Actinomycetota bacterium]|nr:hypothetical protein [Actinomycetota bacterium]